MATFNSRSIIEEMLLNDGIFPGDPQASSIWEYRSAVTGQVMWAVFYNEAHNDLCLSPYVGEYRCLWNRWGGHLAPLGVLEK